MNCVGKKRGTYQLPDSSDITTIKMLLKNTCIEVPCEECPLFIEYKGRTPYCDDLDPNLAYMRANPLSKLAIKLP
jgi:hypothetical protein